MKMRRIAAAVLILSLAAGGYALAQVSGQKDDARVYEKTIAGDAKAAEGLTVNFGASVSQSGLNWKNTYCYGADGENKQKVDFLKSNPDRTAYEKSYQTSVSFDIYQDFDLQSINELFYERQEEVPPAGKEAREKDKRKKEIKEILKTPFTKNAERYMKKLWAGIPENGESDVTIHMKDLMDYYILSGWINGTGEMLDMNFSSLAANEGEDYELELAKKWKAWNDFFKIPVLKEEYMTYRLAKGNNGELSVTTDYGITEGGDEFGFNIQSCDTEDASYFFFDAHSLNGRVVDTSLIPGGFGIYRMPHEGKEGRSAVEELENIYRLDPNAYYQSIAASPDGKKLMISYYYSNAGGQGKDEDEKVTLLAEVIDLASGKRDEKITLLENCEWPVVRSDGEFQVFTDNESRLKIYRYMDGRYRKIVDAKDMDFSLPGLTDITSDNTKIIYEEGRVSALCYETINTWEDGVPDERDFGTFDRCVSAVLNVFTEDKLAYCGRLYNNLQDFYDIDTYKGIVQKLREEKRWGKTFVTDARYPYGINTTESILKLETNLETSKEKAE